MRTLALRLLVVAALSVTSAVGTTGEVSALQSEASNATALAAAAGAVGAALLSTNKLGISKADLRTLKNPKGDGTFVYVDQTQFSGVERYLIWVVVGGKAYALNGASKGVTPTLPLPRDAPVAVWKQTGLNAFLATEAIDLVFGKK